MDKLQRYPTFAPTIESRYETVFAFSPNDPAIGSYLLLRLMPLFQVSATLCARSLPRRKLMTLFAALKRTCTQCTMCAISNGTHKNHASGPSALTVAVWLVSPKWGPVPLGTDERPVYGPI